MTFIRTALAMIATVSVALATSMDSGCANSRGPSGSSETHFLRECGERSCGVGLTCVCGVCTKACEASVSCGSLAAGAACVSQGQACVEARICDVACGADADCSELGSAHRCEDGRCRAPAPGGSRTGGSTMQAGSGRAGSGGRGANAGTSADAGTRPGSSIDGSVAASTCKPPECTDLTGSTPPPSASGCEPSDVLRLLAQGEQVHSCGSLPAEPSREQAHEATDCVREQLAVGNAFELSWKGLGFALEGTSGVIGVREGDALNVYSYGYDPEDMYGTPATWLQCHGFTVGEPGSCGNSSLCFSCNELGDSNCRCAAARPPSSVAIVTCSGENTSPPRSCEVDGCYIDGSCYVNGATSADGCCTCSEGVARCSQDASCPGWLTLGKRCANDADCGSGSGLACQKNFAGERGVCSRSCHDDCPPGSECISVPHYIGGTVDKMCMRPCADADDCMLEVRGAPLGSECDSPGNLAYSYCF